MKGSLKTIATILADNERKPKKNCHNIGWDHIKGICLTKFLCPNCNNTKMMSNPKCQVTVMSKDNQYNSNRSNALYRK